MSQIIINTFRTASGDHSVSYQRFIIRPWSSDGPGSPQVEKWGIGYTDLILNHVNLLQEAQVLLFSKFHSRLLSYI